MLKALCLSSVSWRVRFYMHTGVFLFIMALSVPALSAEAGEKVEKFRYERQLMGTRFSVVFYTDNQAKAESAAAAAFDMAEKLNAVASDYLPESELSLLVSKPIGRPIPLSALLYDLLDHSRRLAEATDGAFDPTLGPLTKLWREARTQGSLPEAAALQSALSRVGWQHFTLDAASQSITLHRKDMAFDLGGMAKGYAADLMLESLASHGISRAMIAAGGDIRVGEPPPDREGWRVALQTFDLSRFDEVMTLSNAAVSTSGDLHQSVEMDGIRYSHILDPGTGLGLTRRVAAIVIASEGKISDALATAACVLGPEAGDKVKNFPGVRELKLRTP